MAPGGQPPTGVSGAGTQARLWGWGWGADYSRCLSACPPPPDALPTQAAEDGVAVQLQKDSNGFLIAGGGVSPHSSAHAEFILPFVKF